jgi:hypothetical protein
MKHLSIVKLFALSIMVAFASLSKATETASFESSAAVYSASGGSVSFDVSFDYIGQSLSTMGLLVDLPAGWSYASASGANIPPVVPEAGTTTSAEFAYFSIPANSIGFTITLDYAAGLTGDQAIGGTVIYKISGNSTALNAALGPVTILAAISPAITSQPESATVISGGMVTFTTAVSGTPAPTLQWRKNGEAIAGETSASYQIDAVGLSDAADYDVVATNVAGSVTSNAAALTVHVPVSISVSPQSQSLTVGQTLTLSVQADGFPTPTYQWRKGGGQSMGRRRRLSQSLV